MQNEKIDIKSLYIDEIQDGLKAVGLPRFHAAQIFRWLHKGAESFNEMSDLPFAARKILEERYFISIPEIWKKQISKKDGTIKYLWRLWDGNGIESVFMRYKHGNTLCISTQVGCRMGCRFCASTKKGLIRNLAPSEMLDQILYTQKDTGDTVSNIVLMGTGEPLDNYDNTVKFLRILNDPTGLNKGFRHISLSTCGLCDRIQKLTEERVPITLSVSLHAAEDSVRSHLMPVNRIYHVSNILECCREYFKKTGRRISFEYALISGVNDRIEDAEKLAQALAGMSAHVNLILLNHVIESSLKPSTRSDAQNFADILKKRGVNVTFRRRLGGDIDAACGQLRNKNES